MIEIKPATGRKNDKTRIKNKKGASGIDKNSKTFASNLNQAITENITGTIDELLEHLSDREKDFLDYQSLYELNKYKQLVQKILRLITEEGFTIKTFKPTRKHGLEMKIVQDINMKMLEIKEAITRSNKAFDLMKSIEEIRGLILDLVS